MNRRMTGPDHSLNSSVSDDGDGEWQDWLIADDDSQEILLSNRQQLSQQRDLLTKALKVLSQRERHIIKERRLKESPATLQNLSDHYGISRERIRQIEVRAFEKLRKSVKNSMISQRLAH
ncbi:MAG: sigma-70 family RNA polymerase sigma factor, partial [Rhodospirillaceae bacterium]